MLVLKGGRQVGFGPPKDLFEAVKRQQPGATVPAEAAQDPAPAALETGVK
jgi:hypothetical protein